MGFVDDYPPARLQELPARPPTPPRGATHHDVDILAKHLIATQQWSLQTPPGILSPSTSSKDSSTRKKRVGFSSRAQFQEAPTYHDSSSVRQITTPGSLPSSTSRPVKGILKASAASNRLAPANRVSLDGDKPGQIQIADMLESTLQQLAGSDRESKIDAYIMLFRGLKASTNLPDRIALQEKMGLFMQFIQRDLKSKAATGKIDRLLVTSALKLLHTFLHFHGVASSIPRDFGVFLIDHCVRAFEDTHSIKEVVGHLMQALYSQNFTPDVMTGERIGRLITALHNIERYITGKSIILGRIRVYEKLVKQCPQHMAVHSDWLQDLFTDMLSSASDIRSAATKLGLTAAFTLNKDKRLNNRTVEILNLSLEDNKYIELVTQRLNAMLDDKEDCVAVPRIWSIITLLIPNSDHWDYWKPWLNIMQQCFNHSSISTIKEALLAWNRYIYRVHIDRRLNQHSVVKLIQEPLLSKLKRKGLRDSALSGIRNFFYYAFRPDLKLKILDELWDSAIVPFMKRLSGNAVEDTASVTQGAALLTSLLDCKTRRVWRENRVADPTLIKDDELPAIEAKWVRANSFRVFELLDPLLRQGFSEIAVSGSQYQKLWRAVVHSVASASVKDVKLHDDTAKFVASAFGLLSTVWSEGPGLTISGQPCSPSQFLDSTKEFIQILISGLGLLPNPFLDRHFIQTKDHTFVVHATSSHRSSKGQGVRRLPLHHLFLILSYPPANVPDDSDYAKFSESVFAPFFGDKNEKAQADLGQELLRLLPMDATYAYGPWNLCATKILLSLEAGQFSSHPNGSGSGGNLGSEFREIVKILERGVRSTPNLPSECWTRLFQSLKSNVKAEADDAGVAIVLVEPLASVIADLIPDEKEGIISPICLDATIEVIAASTHPHDKQAVDIAKRRLWGTSDVANRSPSFDPFDNLYKLVNGVLEKLYANIGSYDSETVVLLLREVKLFFVRGDSELTFRALTSLQDGVACCLEDRDHRLTTDFPGVAESVSPVTSVSFPHTDISQIRSLWQTLLSVIISPAGDKVQLDPVEVLLCAAFKSTHRDTVNVTAEVWNKAYDSAENIDYPTRLKEVLGSLGHSTNIVLSGLEIFEGQPNQHANFSRSHDEKLDLHSTSVEGSQAPHQPPRSVLPRTATIGSAESQDRSPNETGAISSGWASARGRTPRSKLRHKDPQLEFTVIDYTPGLLAPASEVLTDRRTGVRERQQQNATLFPEIRSSPTEKTKKARSNTSQNLQEVASRGFPKASTPENERSFEDCLTSTPTPRRGQAVMLPEQDQDMTDPPSSPPEPRSHRLLAELKIQANDKSSIDEWQFSSSPVSGSPNLAHRTIAASHPMELDEVTELRLDDEDDECKNSNVQGAGRMETSSQQDIIEQATILEYTEMMALPAHQQGSDSTSPATPSGRQLRSRLVQITPRSDNEEFVDARSSPLPPTPNRYTTMDNYLASTVRRSPRNTTNSQSFAVSASFENILRGVGSGRIEIPLRSTDADSPRKKQYTSYKDILPVSPEHAQEAGPAQSGHQSRQPLQNQQLQDINGDDSALETIEVAGKSYKKPKSGQPRRSKRGQLSHSPQAARTHHVTVPMADTADDFENVSPGSGRWWRKRKRSVSSIFSSGGSKKARHHDVLNEEAHQDEIPNSQPDVVVNEAVLASSRMTDQSDHGVATQVAEELFENNVLALASNLTSSSSRQRQREPSQELASLNNGVAAAVDPPVTDIAADEDLAMEGTSDYADDEEAILSQLTREEQDASLDKEQHAPLAHVTASPQTNLEPSTSAAEANEIGSKQQAVEDLEPSKFDGLIAMLRNGLDALRSAELTREQFYQAEDLFFEFKKELFEAERRGRGE